MLRSLRVLAAFAVLGFASAAFAQQVDNPAYQNWAKYKPGTSITLQQSATMAMMPNMVTQTTITQKLLEVKPESVSVEVTTKTTMMGQASENKATNVIPAKVDKGQEYAPQSANMKVEVKDLKEGTDTVDVKGTKVDTVTHEFTATMTSTATAPATNPAAAMMAGGMTSKVKIWSTPTVPGGMVKSEQTTTMGTMGEMKSSITLVDYTIVK